MFETFYQMLRVLQEHDQASYIKGSIADDNEVWEIGKMWISFDINQIHCIGLNEKNQWGEHIVVWRAAEDNISLERILTILDGSIPQPGWCLWQQRGE